MPFVMRMKRSKQRRVEGKRIRNKKKEGMTRKREKKREKNEEKLRREFFL